MNHDKKDFKLNRTITTWDRRRLQAMLTAAGQLNNKMSKQRFAEYLADSYPDVMGYGGWASWFDFINAITDMNGGTKVYPAIYLELFSGVLFRETVGASGPSNG